MREKLIELLCKAHNAVTDKSLENDSEFGMTYAEQIETEADNLIANGVTLQKWIPVSERLPEDNKKVLVLLVSKIEVIAILRNNVWHVSWNQVTLNRVTHWMQLPNPPKED